MIACKHYLLYNDSKKLETNNILLSLYCTDTMQLFVSIVMHRVMGMDLELHKEVLASKIAKHLAILIDYYLPSDQAKIKLSRD